MDNDFIVLGGDVFNKSEILWISIETGTVFLKNNISGSTPIHFFNENTPPEARRNFFKAVRRELNLNISDDYIDRFYGDNYITYCNSNSKNKNK